MTGNTHTISLVNTVDVVLCTHTEFWIQQSLSGLSTSGSREYIGMKEYGYYRALDTNMSGKVVMMDFGLVYLTGGQTYNFNQSTVIVTGSYLTLMQQNQGFPWNTRFAHNKWVSIAVNDEGKNKSSLDMKEGTTSFQIFRLRTIWCCSIGTSYGQSTLVGFYNWESDFFNIEQHDYSL